MPLVSSLDQYSCNRGKKVQDWMKFTKLVGRFFKHRNIGLMDKVNKIKLLSMESYRTFIKSRWTAGCDAASQYHLFFGFEMVYGNSSCFPVDSSTSAACAQAINESLSKYILPPKFTVLKKFMKYVEHRSLYHFNIWTHWREDTSPPCFHLTSDFG